MANDAALQLLQETVEGFGAQVSQLVTNTAGKIDTINQKAQDVSDAHDEIMPAVQATLDARDAVLPAAALVSTQAADVSAKAVQVSTDAAVAAEAKETNLALNNIANSFAEGVGYAADTTGVNAYFSVRRGGVGPDGVTTLSRTTCYKRTGVGTATAFQTILAGEDYDAVLRVSTGPYTWVERDAYGRMSRYVTKAGATWIRLHSAVVLPGAQLAPGSVASAALATELFTRMVPTGYTYTTSRRYPFTMKDANGRLSELTIEASGRFPTWVAKSLAARAGASRAGVVGRSVRLSEVYLDATELPDGPTVPMDTGQASTSYGIAPMKVVSGQVVHDAVRTPNNGGYVEVALSKKVNKIGCACIFPAGSELSSIALVLPSTSWITNPGGTVAGIHYVLSGNGAWHCSYFAGGEQNYVAGSIAALTDGKTYFTDVEIDGNDVKITLPDTSVIQFTDTRVSANITNLAIWELYEFTVQPARAAMTAMWADSPAIVASKQDARLMARLVQKFLNGF